MYRPFHADVDNCYSKYVRNYGAAQSLCGIAAGKARAATIRGWPLCRSSVSSAYQRLPDFHSLHRPEYGAVGLPSLRTSCRYCQWGTRLLYIGICPTGPLKLRSAVSCWRYFLAMDMVIDVEWSWCLVVLHGHLFNVCWSRFIKELKHARISVECHSCCCLRYYFSGSMLLVKSVFYQSF